MLKSLIKRYGVNNLRIVVNDIAASKTGALSILIDFYHYILEYDTENEWIFLLGDSYVEETAHIKVRILSNIKKSWINRLKFDLFSGAAYIKKLQPDVVFSLQNTLTCGYKGKQVLYVHQPLGFQTVKKFSFFKKREREYAVYQYGIGRLINHSIRKADKVIVQTEWMKEAVAKKTRVSSEKIIKILPDTENLSQYKHTDLHQSNQFFFPSGIMIYKNHECIMRACEILNQKGMVDFNVLFTVDSTNSVTSYHYHNKYENILCSGRLTKEEVLNHYNKRVLIFPSYIETFGYPLAEARQLDAMIFASDCPFCHEVLEDYRNAYYFDPFQPKELADLMEKSIMGILKIEPSDSSKSATGGNSWAKVLQVILENSKVSIK